jgi:hypothetical protein
MTTLKNGIQIDEELLFDYADGLLFDADAAELAQLIRSNATLRSQYESVMAQRQALRAVLRLEAPDKGFSAQVLAKWQAEQVQATRPKPVRDWRLVVVPVGLSALLMLSLGGVVLSVLLDQAPAKEPSQPLLMPDIAMHVSNLPEISNWITHPVTYLIGATLMGWLTIKLAERLLIAKLQRA